MRIKVPSKKVRERFLLIYELEGRQKAVNFLTKYCEAARAILEISCSSPFFLLLKRRQATYLGLDCAGVHVPKPRSSPEG
jgi:hypothetical protein